MRTTRWGVAGLRSGCGRAIAVTLSIALAAGPLFAQAPMPPAAPYPPGAPAPYPPGAPAPYAPYPPQAQPARPAPPAAAPGAPAQYPPGATAPAPAPYPPPPAAPYPYAPAAPTPGAPAVPPTAPPPPAPPSFTGGATIPTPKPPAPGTKAKPLSESLTGQAKASYDGGKLLYADGDFAGALVKFQQAYQQSGDPRLLWNQAACEKNLRHYAKVLGLLDQYRKVGTLFMDEKDRQDATDLGTTVRAFVSALRINVAEAGAQVYVDDEVVGTTPLGEVLVDMGPRRIRVMKPGFRAFDEPEQAVGGGRLELNIELQRDLHEGQLAINATQGATITIDGRPLGETHWEGKLASGGHQLKISANGMRTYQGDVVVEDNQTRRIDITLEAEAKSKGSALLWIAGGVLVAGAATGAYFLAKPTKERDATPGNLQPGVTTTSVPIR